LLSRKLEGRDQLQDLNINNYIIKTYPKKKYKLLLAFEEGFCCIDLVNHPNIMKQILSLIIPSNAFVFGGFIAPASGKLVSTKES